MHRTPSGDRRQALKKTARELARDARALQKAAQHLPAARQEAKRLQGEAEKALAQAEALKLQARVQQLLVLRPFRINAESAPAAGCQAFGEGLPSDARGAQ